MLTLIYIADNIMVTERLSIQSDIGETKAGLQ